MTVQPPNARIPLLLVAIGAVIALSVIEVSPKDEPRQHHEARQRAVHQTKRAFDALSRARLARGIAIEPRYDPRRTGLIGAVMSPITSVPGSLSAKDDAINPHFSAAIVTMLLEAGVGRDEVVAIGASGSFPAFTVATLAATRSIGAAPLCIASLASSAFGANDPRWTWLDMEADLRAADLLQPRSIAASIGGIDDRGLGLSEEGVSALRRAAARHDVPLLRDGTLRERVSARRERYLRAARGRRIGVYVNIGGGVTSAGGEAPKRAFRAGLNTSLPSDLEASADGVMIRFATEGVPVINLVRVRELTERYQVPAAPRRGEDIEFTSSLYRRVAARRVWVALALAAILMALILIRLRLARKRRRWENEHRLAPTPTGSGDPGGARGGCPLSLP